MRSMPRSPRNNYRPGIQGRNRTPTGRMLDLQSLQKVGTTVSIRKTATSGSIFANFSALSCRILLIQGRNNRKPKLDLAADQCKRVGCNATSFARFANPQFKTLTLASS